MDEKTARTKLDILYHDVLGEINETINRVESIKSVLPAQAADVETRLTTIIGILSTAADAYRTTLDKYTNEQGDVVRIQMESDYRANSAKLERETHDAIRATLAQVERTVKNTVKNEITEPVQSVLRVAEQSMWVTIGLCIVSGLLGGVIAFAGNTLIIGHDDPYYAQYGRAVAVVWNKLDPKSQTLIEKQMQ
jgi:hypothetical protein